jgi:hypothetical protein
MGDYKERAIEHLNQLKEKYKVDEKYENFVKLWSHIREQGDNFWFATSNDGNFKLELKDESESNEAIAKEYPYLLVDEDMGGTLQVIMKYKTKAEAERALARLDRDYYPYPHVIKNHHSVADKKFITGLINYDDDECFDGVDLDREKWDNYWRDNPVR